MSRHWIFLTAMGFFVASLVFLCLWWAYGRLLLSGSPKAQSFRRRIPFWRRLGSKTGNLNDYELLRRRYSEDRFEA
jgi:hypothetical protein